MELKAIVTMLLLTGGAPSMQQGSSQSPMCQHDNFCVTKECIAHANEIINNADFDVNPCEDFYQFTCGNFLREKQIPPSHTVLDSTTQNEDAIYSSGKKLVDSEPKNTDFETDNLVRNQYAACMNTSMREIIGTQPVTDMLDALGGWPILMDNWSDQDFSWYNYDIKSNELGMISGNILSMKIEKDRINAQAHKIHFSPASFGLYAYYLLMGIDEPQVQYYYNLMVDLAKLLGADEQRAIVEMKEVLQFETDLAACKQSFNSYQSVRLGDYQIPPGFPASLKDFINDMFQAVGVTEVSVDDNDQVGFIDPGYISKVSDLLLNTTNKVIANYLGWRIVFDNLRYTSNVRKEYLTPYSTLRHGTEELMTEWQHCLYYAGFDPYNRESLAGAAGSMYARNYFNNEARDEVVSIFQYIKEALRETLIDTEWMEPGVKAVALEKLDNMMEVIGYPEELLDQDEVANFFGGLVMHKDQFFTNMQNLKTFWRKKDMEKLRQPVQPYHWTEDLRIFKNYMSYQAWKNLLQVPAGSLQDIVFNANAPKYANYGSIGTNIAHDISHGFDTKGNQYDQYGNENTWWDNATETAFDRKTVCINQQYGNYFVDQVQLYVSAVNTLQENVADNGAIKIAYNGYNDYVSDHGDELALPGLAFTPKQLFWISYGKSMCEKRPDSIVMNEVLYSSIPPNQFRVNGALKNNLDFARDFNCPVGSSLNPTNKCAVW